MKDVGSKPETRRSARASCVLHAPDHCIALLRSGETEKGDALKTARVAGILAAKRTDELIPLCHPLPIYRADIDYELADTSVKVIATVETIGPTGVEMEALTAASLAALTLYDMLKPHCEPAELRITDTHLEEKKGGKSQFGRKLRVAANAQVIVLSDTVAAGRKPDTAGRAVEAALQRAGFAQVGYEVIADEPDDLRQRIDAAIDAGVALIMTVGGTGVSPRDCTVETVTPYLLQPLPGLMEAARAFGQRRTPYAALSRGIAGYARNNSLIVTCPGSKGGASETLAAIQPALIHLIEVCRPGKPHAGGYQ
jgi:cyclic pyranopterin monophosphate synthase